jgi:hypothetical protein
MLGFSSSTTWTCPAGITQIQVEVWGAGGGAGGRGGFRCTNTSGGSCVGLCAAAYGGYKGGDGGNGGYNKQVINVNPGQTYSITIGQGGVAGAAGGDNTTSFCMNNHPACNGGNGTNGGSSSFSNLVIANGGLFGTGGNMTNLVGGNMQLLATCSVSGAGIDGLDASILNYSYPPQTNGTRTYLPTGYVTNYPSSSAPGGLSYGIGNPYQNGAPAATAGENGFCIITY